MGQKLAALFLLLFTMTAFPQDQLALRFNEKGILKILQMAVQYNSSSKNAKTVVIPQNIYKFTIPKAQIQSNPIVPIVSEISDLNVNKDLEFYFHTSEIKISGEVDSKSLKAQIFNSNDNGFDVKLSLALPSVSIQGNSLSLCEDRQKGKKNCGEGLKATLTNVKITTKKKPVLLSAVLRIRTSDNVARISVRSVESNLEGKNSPELDIGLKSIEIPRIAIVIDDQETELDTSKLKDELLKRKKFLAQKLLSFAADFIANDVAEMMNVYLVNKKVATSYQINRKENLGTFDEYLSEESFPMKDGDYERPPVNPQDNPMTVMMGQISDVLNHSQVGISLKKITTPLNKDIELSGLVSFLLNGQQIDIKNTYGNTDRLLPKLDLSSQRNYDINLAISEPLLNGALDLANTTNLFQEIFEALSPVKGFSIKNVKLHFLGDKSLVAVVNAQVDLKQLQHKDAKSWFKNKVAAWLERNNNDAIIYFPIEVPVIPVFKTLADGGTGLDLRVLSPFEYKELPNRFKYPTNVPEMNETVKDGVMEELRGSLEPHTNKTYSIDVTKFLNQAGVVFMPKTISINQGAYLLMSLDIVDIKFNSKNPNQR